MTSITKKEMPSLLTELPEDQAHGEILKIYQEIRRLSAVPMVALIWRHLATLPGTLEWAWGVLEPTMRSGILQEMAWEIAENTRIQRQPRITVSALRAAGISEEDQRGIIETLDGYNRANPVNFVMVHCLSLHLEGTIGSCRPQVLSTWQPPSQPSALRPMVNPSEMSSTVHDLSLLLTNRGTDSAPSQLFPSLYRHLAYWPAFLGYATVLVLPDFQAIDIAAEQMRLKVHQSTATLTASLVPAAGKPAPSGQQSVQLRRALSQFSIRIPEMVVIGNLLRASMPDPS